MVWLVYHEQCTGLFNSQKIMNDEFLMREEYFFLSMGIK